jgi:class 3 adenylate cyclase
MSRSTSGDGLLVYFGYPVASEDDPRRAVRAGLGIIEAIGKRSTRACNARGGITIAVRVGIHTGPVVIGEIGGASRREELALGRNTERRGAPPGHRRVRYRRDQRRDASTPAGIGHGD